MGIWSENDILFTYNAGVMARPSKPNVHNWMKMRVRLPPSVPLLMGV
jgi:hypothetical protein